MSDADLALMGFVVHKNRRERAVERVIAAAKAWDKHPRRDTKGFPIQAELHAAVKELEELENG